MSTLQKFALTSLLSIVTVIMAATACKADQLFLPVVSSGNGQTSSVTTCPAWVWFEPDYYDDLTVNLEVWATLNSLSGFMADGETMPDLLVATDDSDRFTPGLWDGDQVNAQPVLDALNLAAGCGKGTGQNLSGLVDVSAWAIQDWETQDNLTALVNFIGGYATDNDQVMERSLNLMAPEIAQHVSAMMTYYATFQ